MNPDDYRLLADFLRQSSGLILGEGREYLVSSRLNPLVRRFELIDVGCIVKRLAAGDNAIGNAVIDAMTTNETLFFRDKTPFEELHRVLLPELVESRRAARKLRIWCAAGATGQEPYSIAMLLSEYFPEFRAWDIEIIATDIAAEPIARAKKGLYSQFEVQRGLPVEFRNKYFTHSEAGWQLIPAICNAVTWRQLNLLKPFDFLGRFDIIFCRNVLIYFDSETKRSVLNQICSQMSSDAYLYLGAAETALGVCDDLERRRDCRSALYTLAGATSGAESNVTRPQLA
ncbi:CheR family methyltransferase [Stratiformator vulcanicus]|uniref:protein-glutamate O-methyltransferase n=1 Tax=Stratiformator vulcanicus TaxID=2527980 RepID=A0A517R1P1_9PLAN|nr:protein-glutamate O-methyltransferase CheR [Stratiformator vulcanicus]QDT37819.1 Chemotaxis protein methyltransferase Cher2 [Stratiformator vulcanicus]